MTAVLAVLHASAIILIGAFLFTAMDFFETNPRLATVFKIAIFAAGAAAIANQVLPGGLLAAIGMGR
jgi:uncharacterized membrane protein